MAGQLELVVEPFEVGLQVGEPVLVCAEELLGLVAFGGGDDHARVVQINLATDPTPYRVIGRYRIGCGYHLFGTPELEPAPSA